MSSKPSLIGLQASTPAQMQRRNSFKIFETQEQDLQALDFEKLGMNTIHAKDRTLIYNINYADVKGVYGEISPGKKIEYSPDANSEVEFVPCSDLDELSGLGGAKVLRHLVTWKAIVGSTPGVEGTQSQDLFLPQTLDVDLYLEQNCPGNGDAYIQIVPTVGSARITASSKSGNGSNDIVERLWLSYSFGLISSSECFFTTKCNNGNVNQDFYRGSSIDMVGERCVVAPKQVYVADSSHATLLNPISYNKFMPRVVSVARITWTGLDMSSGRKKLATITFAVTPIDAMGRNVEPNELTAESTIMSAGSQLFFSNLSSIDVEEGCSCSYSTKAILYKLDGLWSNTYGPVLYTGESRTLIPVSPEPVNQSEPRIYLHIAKTAGDISYVEVVAKRMETIITPTGVPLLKLSNGDTVPAIKVNSVKITASMNSSMSDSFLIDFSSCGKRVVMAVCVNRAEDICPQAYSSNRTYPYYVLTRSIVSIELDDKEHGEFSQQSLSLVPSNISGGVVSKPGGGNTWISSGPDGWTSVQTTGSRILPQFKRRQCALFFGNSFSIANSVRIPIPFCYGGTVGVYSSTQHSVAHAEFPGVSAEYFETLTMPIIVPSLSLFSSCFTSDLNSTEPLGYPLGGMLGASPMNTYSAGVPLTSDPEWANYIAPVSSGINFPSLYGMSISPEVGSLHLISLPSIDRAGTPNSVMFAQDIIGAEFSLSPKINGKNQVGTMSGRYVSTDNNLYSQSSLYMLSTVASNKIAHIGSATDGYLSVAQYIFARNNGVTNLYVEDRNGLSCIATLPGSAVDSPVVHSNGVLAACQEDDVVTLYSITIEGILPIKRVPLSNANGQALMKLVGAIGLGLFVRDNRLFTAYAIREALVSLVSRRSNVEYVSYVERSGQCDIFVTDSDLERFYLSGLSDNPTFDISSDQFHFPMIDGYKPVLSGIKLCWAPGNSSKNFDLTVKVNGRQVYKQSGIQCNIENVIVFDKQFPVGNAEYSISNARGTLRNAFWIIAPMPLVPENIAPFKLGENTVTMDKESEKIVSIVGNNYGTAIEYKLSYSPDFDVCIPGHDGVRIETDNGSFEINVNLEDDAYGTTVYAKIEDVDQTETVLPEVVDSVKFDDKPIPKPVLSRGEALGTSRTILVVIEKDLKLDATLKIDIDGQQQYKITTGLNEFVIDLDSFAGKLATGTKVIITATLTSADGKRTSPESDTLEVTLT